MYMHAHTDNNGLRDTWFRRVPMTYKNKYIDIPIYTNCLLDIRETNGSLA